MQTIGKLKFEIKNSRNAPVIAQPILKAAKKTYGFIPNLFGLMANHPALLNAYWQSDNFLAKNSVFTPIERQVAFLATSFENKCNYCMAAHTTVGQKVKAPEEVIDALRKGITIPDTKLEALSQYVKATTVKRGRVSQDDIQNFLAAGYTQESILEIIAIVGFKVFANYTDYLSWLPIDIPFEANSWAPNDPLWH